MIHGNEIGVEGYVCLGAAIRNERCRLEELVVSTQIKVGCWSFLHVAHCVVSVVSYVARCVVSARARTCLGAAALPASESLGLLLFSL